MFSGTFQNIEHIFIVGVAGGVPQFADYYRHPRLGDIVLSKCDSKGYIYYYCDKITQVMLVLAVTVRGTSITTDTSIHVLLVSTGDGSTSSDSKGFINSH